MPPLSVRDELIRFLIKQGPLALVLGVLVYFGGDRIVLPLVNQSITTMQSQDKLLVEMKTVVSAIQVSMEAQLQQNREEIEILRESRQAHERQLGYLEKFDKTLVPKSRVEN